MAFEDRLRDGRRLTATSPSEALDRYLDALALWRGDPYVDLDRGDAALIGRQRLVRLRVEAMVGASRCMVETGRVDLASLEHWHVAEPSNEQIAVSLGLALYQAGDQVNALEFLRGFRRMLGEEYGLEATRVVEEAEERILRHEAGPRPAPLAVNHPKTAPPDRSGTFDRILAMMQAENPPRLLVLHGPAGIGKSTLMQGLATALASTYDIVAVDDGDSVELARSLVVIAGGDPLAVRPEPAAHDAWLELLLGLTVRRTPPPVLLVVDDCDGLDEALQRLLRQFSGRLPWVTVMAAARVGRRAVDALGSDAESAEHTCVVEIGGVGQDAARAILRQFAGELRWQDDLASTLLARTGGNPFLLTAMARHLGVHGSAERLPVTVRAFVESVIGSAGQLGRELSELAAIDDGVFSISALVRATGHAPDDVTAVVESLIGLGVVSERRRGDTPELAFCHDLVREAVHEDVGSARRPLLAARLSQAYLADPRIQPARLYGLLEVAGSVAPRGELEQWAARTAADLYEQGSYAAAARHWERAVTVGRGNDSTPTELAGWWLRAAEAWHVAGRVDAGFESASLCAAFCREAGLPREFARAAIATAGPIMSTGPDAEAANELLAEALAAASEDIDPVDLVAIVDALVRTSVHAPVDRRHPLDEVLNQALERQLPPSTRSRALRAQRALALSGAAPATSRLALSSAAVACHRAGPPRDLLDARHVHCIDLIETGDPSAVSALADYVVLAGQAASPFHQWFSLMATAAVMRYAGLEARAEEARAAAAGWEEILDAFQVARGRLVNACLPPLRRGDMAAVFEQLAGIPPDIDDTGVLGLLVTLGSADRSSPESGEQVARQLQALETGPLRKLAAALVAVGATNAAPGPGPATELALSILADYPDDMIVVEGGLAILGPVAAFLQRIENPGAVWADDDRQAITWRAMLTDDRT